jgi:hypothetical protein
VAKRAATSLATDLITSLNQDLTRVDNKADPTNLETDLTNLNRDPTRADNKADLTNLNRDPTRADNKADLTNLRAINLRAIRAKAINLSQNLTRVASNKADRATGLTLFR